MNQTTPVNSPKSKRIPRPSAAQRHGISLATLDNAGVRHIEAEEAMGSVGISMSGLVIPYTDHHGKPIFDSNQPFNRLRLDTPFNGMKYFQRKGSTIHAYVPPGAGNGGRDGDLIIVEGEFKALSLLEAGYPAIGISGFYGFADSEGKLVRELDDVIRYLQPKRILFVGDADTATNYQFADAAIRFAALVAPIPVLLPRIPISGPGKGVDDCREMLGTDFDQWWKTRMDEAVPVQDHTIGSLVLILLQVESEAIGKLTGAERANIEQRLAKLAAMLRHDPLNQDRLIDICTNSLSVGKQAFTRAVRLGEEKVIEQAAASSSKTVVELTPWPNAVDGADLLDDLRRNYGRFMVLPSGTDVLLAVWTLHTYVFDQFGFTPYLHVTSPEKECGKSTLAELMNHLCSNATTPGGMSAAAMYRRIEAKRPTLLLDEWDTLSDENRQAALNVLNTGFKYNGVYTICVGDDHEDKDFHTFCPKAIFGLSAKKLPDTTQSRCFSLTLQKKLSSESVEKLTRKFDGSPLRRKCLRWANDHRDKLNTEPVMPPGLSARQEDISEPLLAIADGAGGNWPELVRKCVCALFEIAQGEDASTGVELLRDLSAAFADAEQFASDSIVHYLNSIEDRPWGGWNEGKGITQRQLASKLKPFKIFSTDVWVAGDDGKKKNLKGYHRDHFADAFNRYLSQNPIPIRESARVPANIEENSLLRSASETTSRGCQNLISSNGDAGSRGLADEKAQGAEIEEKEPVLEV